MCSLMKYLCVPVVVGLMVSFATPAEALVVNADPSATSNPALHNTEQAGHNMWDHVGRTSTDGTAVYLGNGWAMTANHVAVGSNTSIVLSGTSYARDASEPIIRLDNPSGLGGQADLKLFKINGDPGLPKLPITSSTALVGDSLIMISEGRGRNSELKQVGSTGPPPTTFHGYEWDGAPREKTWANNSVSVLTGPLSDASGGQTLAFRTTFNSNIDGDGQATQWDSGGSAFRFNNISQQWELIGTILAINAFVGQDSNTAAFGNQTFLADLSIYRDQINSIVPEPASLALFAAGGAMMVWRRRRD